MFRKWLPSPATLVLACVALFCAFFLSHPSTVFLGTGGDVPVPLLLGMIAPLIVPKTFQQLREIANPSQPGQSEATPWVLFDSQTYTSAATTVLNFFQTQQNDRTLSNLLQGGALTDPQWFEIYNLAFDVLNDATTGASETGIGDDIQKLMLVGRPIFTLAISDKNYGPFPLSYLHTSGGFVGNLTGTTAAGGSTQIGNNSIPDGGWNWRGSIIIPPKVGFSVQVQWAAAQTLAGGNPVLRFSMAGCLHRRIV